MSWFRDPQLFIVCELDMQQQFYVVRVKKEFGSHIAGKSDLITGDCEELDFSKHLSFGNNRESDFTHFLCYWSTCFCKFINSQGWVITCTEFMYPESYTWSREKLDSPFYRLPGLSIKAPATVANEGDEREKAQVQALVKRVLDLKLSNCALKDEREREKAGKQALEKRVSVLELNNRVFQHEARKNKEEKQALEERVSIMEANFSTLRADTANLVCFMMADMANIVNREMESTGIDILISDALEQQKEKNDKQPLEKQVDTSSSSPETPLSKKKKKKKKKNKKQVSELTSKLKKGCGSGSGLVDEEPSRDSKEQ